MALGCILQWLQFPEGWASAFLDVLGATPHSHISAMAVITVEEFEAMIGVANLGEVNVTPIFRSKMRQVLLAARCVVGIIRAPPEASRPASTSVAPATPPLADNAWDTVHLNDVIRQGADIKCKRMDDEEFKRLRAYYKKRRRASSLLTARLLLSSRPAPSGLESTS